MAITIKRGGSSSLSKIVIRVKIASKGYLHQEKKNLPRIFRLVAQSNRTCIMPLAAAWQSIGK